MGLHCLWGVLKTIAASAWRTLTLADAQAHQPRGTVVTRVNDRDMEPARRYCPSSSSPFFCFVVLFLSRTILRPSPSGCLRCCCYIVSSPPASASPFSYRRWKLRGDRVLSIYLVIVVLKLLIPCVGMILFSLVCLRKWYKVLHIACWYLQCMLADSTFSLTQLATEVEREVLSNDVFEAFGDCKFHIVCRH